MEPVEQNLQEIIDVVAESVQTGIKQLADGWQYTDIFAFVPVLAKIPEAIKDANKAWEYLQDMTKEKRQDLIDAVLAKLNDATNDTRTLTERIIDAAASNYMLVKWFMDRSNTPDANKTANPNPAKQPGK